MKNRWGKGLIASTCLVVLAAQADVSSDLSNFFNNLGFSNNNTAPNAYQGQSAGYYTGGSIFARDQVRDVQIAEIDLPQLRAGCGGIDLFTGGISIANSSEIVDAMKGVMGHAVGYAFNLALESATPELANAMKYMHNLANEVNRLNINSCETAAGLVGSVWPKTHVAQQQVCQDIGANQNIFSDYADARQGCSAGGRMNEVLGRAQGAYANQVFKSGNVAWLALQKNSFLQNDPELAELFMSLSGTLVLNNTGHDDHSGQQYRVLPSLAGDASLIKALLHGGSTKIYQCDDTSSQGCLNPHVGTLTIAQNAALQAQVAKLLNDMVDKIYADQALSPPEIGLLNATRLPVYKMLNVQAAFAGDKSILDIDDYADVIAADILFQYLDESLGVVTASASSLQYPDSIMQPFLAGVAHARASVRNAEQNAYRQVTMAAQLIEQTQALEQMLTGSLSAQLNNTLSWANNMKQ